MRLTQLLKKIPLCKFLLHLIFPSELHVDTIEWFTFWKSSPEILGVLLLISGHVL